MKLLVVAGLASSLVNFRGPLLTELRVRGHEVHVAAPALSVDRVTLQALWGIGVTGHDVPFDRAGTNPMADGRALLEMIRLVWRLRPDIVLGYTIKPVISAMLAAALAGVPKRVALITGLGYAFTGNPCGKRRLARKIARVLYKPAMARAHLVFFQNPDDLAQFRSLGLLPARVPAMVVNGSGVDLDHYPEASLPEGPPSFLLIARLLGDKGVREYAAAAAAVRGEQREVRFELVGGRDANPDCIGSEELEQWQANSTVCWRGHLDDVRPSIADCSIYVLPSYREGTPRTVLEAMAMGRAIVTTDVPGCRETVVDGLNGFLVPPRNPEALAAAMRRFIDEPALIAKMGAESRRIAEEKYDVHKVNKVMLDAMGL